MAFQIIKEEEDEKLEEVNDPTDLSIFFKYYDGYKTDGEIGFNPRAGPPGSINHMRSFRHLINLGWTDSRFREKGKKMAELALECIDKFFVPPEDLRPDVPERSRPIGMMQEASRCGHY
jgi:hypothetical protein